MENLFYVSMMRPIPMRKSLGWNNESRIHQYPDQESVQEQEDRTNGNNSPTKSIISVGRGKTTMNTLSMKDFTYWTGGIILRRKTDVLEALRIGMKVMRTEKKTKEVRCYSYETKQWRNV